MVTFIVHLNCITLTRIYKRMLTFAFMSAGISGVLQKSPIPKVLEATLDHFPTDLTGSEILWQFLPTHCEESAQTKLLRDGVVNGTTTPWIVLELNT